MAYEDTSVPIHKSQGEISALVMSNGGTAVGFICEPPREGFTAKVRIDGCDYHLRITATCRTPPDKRKVGRSPLTSPTTPQWRAEFSGRERRRVWRVLFYYLKNAFECAAAGVVELREVLLPHIVMPDGMTIGEHILPRLEQAVQQDPSRLLGAGVLQ